MDECYFTRKKNIFLLIIKMVAKIDFLQKIDILSIFYLFFWNLIYFLKPNVFLKNLNIDWKLRFLLHTRSSASAQGREIKAEEFLMPISDLWKVVKHRDNTIYLSYRTLMRTENFDNVAMTKGKRKCSLWNEQLSCSDWVICMI